MDTLNLADISAEDLAKELRSRFPAAVIAWEAVGNNIEGDRARFFFYGPYSTCIGLAEMLKIHLTKDVLNYTEDTEEESI